MRRWGTVLRSDESGLTVVEIIIYLTLSVVVGTIVVTMFISTITAQDKITSTTTAITRGQAAAQGIERSLRNATAVSVSTDGETLKILSTLDTPCQAWRIHNSNLEVATNTALTNWTVFAEGVTPVTGHPAFGWSDATVTYALSFDTDTRPVKFTGGVVPRGTGGNLGATCS